MVAGLNVPLRNINTGSPYGSYSYVIDDSPVSHTYGDQSITALHEIMGHGPASAIGTSNRANNLRVTQMENLLHRLVGRNDDVMLKHGGFTFTYEEAIKLPKY